MDYYISPLGIV